MPKGSQVGYLRLVRWQPYDATIFDCDSTLTTIEGIDELAAELGLTAEIAELTDAAMNGDLDLGEVYARRLQILEPNRDDVRNLRAIYKRNVVPDAKGVVRALRHRNQHVWVVSGGLAEPVADFATWLGFDPDHVRAVGSEYDQLNGAWWDHNGSAESYLGFHEGPLTRTIGKADLIEQAFPTPLRRLLIGDGVSDLRAAHAVELFVAFTGVIHRKAVADAARVVVRSKSIAPVLALILGPATVRAMLSEPEHVEVAQSCIEHARDGAIYFNDAELGRAFLAATDHNWEI